MAHSYLAFIDESGDDGLGNYREPSRRGGSTKWLVISACLFRQSYNLEAVSWRDSISEKFVNKKNRHLHFMDLNHQQRIVAAQTIGGLPLRALSVIAAKPPIPEGIYTSKNQLYFYMTRYLIERISWLCRDYRPNVPEGDGRVKITFSRRGGMSYESFRAYLQHMKDNPSPEMKIHWPVIDIDAVDAQDHKKSASLQLVDAIASSFAAAVEPDFYGNCELRYAEYLKPVTYHRKGNYLSYGVKIVPKHEECDLNEQQSKFIDLFK
ncbi:DUF3800 domain-containing protein [Agrobacterium salinitolerans]|uniref:DUF3800 domain-containing protein n=1 Tax=Agrobacterium salinitolerans TaxID=1183413 RepID=A0A9X3QZ60_9HYPH|nr:MULTISPECIES: DUF3800 domain-containing protein [Agrobacterium]MCZ7852717.1 DUF3800 domain-containing protein [Agrobacterium salinitolerans]MCZ7865856.1 DUF3800 domain-containing protein [Agrobacterium salinitolerans]MCZ7890891.1 DUF3800 domain-containing protein [Agrobacterium salinitolerans]MCZ7936565.1 DUF3800 domain-containing protein [Agrobacterium salinitolerans]MCZ7974340.1 DUF3800 domain-containing protein [Agrobacterium salinitolerans]